MSPPKSVFIFFACDPFGVEVKDAVKRHLQEDPSLILKDFGTGPYFTAATNVANAVATHRARGDIARGILVCGTGMGIGIAANKFAGVRAATCESVLVARSARAINDANVLCLGQFFTAPALATEIVDAFLEHEFISQPHEPDGKPVAWWTDAVVSGLHVSEQGLVETEEEAVRKATKVMSRDDDGL